MTAAVALGLQGKTDGLGNGEFIINQIDKGCVAGHGQSLPYDRRLAEAGDTV